MITALSSVMLVKWTLGGGSGSKREMYRVSVLMFKNSLNYSLIGNYFF